MLLKINGIPVSTQLDTLIQKGMSLTPATKAAHWWVTGMVDDAVTPALKVGEAVGYGVYKTADFAGYVMYEKVFPGVLGGLSHVMHRVVEETIKNCGNGPCF